MNLTRLADLWGRLSFRLPALIAVFAALTGAIAGGVAYRFANMGYIEDAKDRMETVRNERARAVTALINDTRIGLTSQVQRPGLGADLDGLARELMRQDDAGRAAVIKAYTEANPFPEGSRSALDDAGDGSGYSAKHKAVHERFLRIQQIQELDDLLLVDTRGNVVYSVRKDGDFGTNLLSGPYSASNAAKVFRAALASQPPWQPAFADMAPYGPGAQPALFMAQAVHDETGRIAGAMLFRLQSQKLRDAANHIQDLGETGEVFLVGTDATRRSQTRFSKGALMTEKLETVSAQRAAGGFTGSTVTIDYKGDEVISAYGAIDVMGVRWGIVSKVDTREALAPLKSMVIATFAGVLGATLLIALLGYLSARRISRPLERSLRIMEKLARGDLHVEIDEGNGIRETRQIAAALKAFHGNMVETQRLLGEITKNQEQMTALLNSSPTGIVVISPDNEVLFVNDPGALILGREKGEFVGQRFSFADIAVAEIDAMRMINAARRDGVVKDAEMAVRLDEHEAILSLSVRRTIYSGKDAFLIWYNDITRQKELQREVETALAVATNERARAEAILAGAPDPILIAHDDGVIEYANVQVSRVLGYDRDELVGRPLETLIPARYRAGHMAHVRGFFGAGELRVMSAGRELYALAKDGREVPVEIALSPIKTGDKNVVVALLRDITIQKAAEKAVRDAKDAAEAATKAKGDFLASMSHEIRTPMNGITGMADLLTQTALDDEQKHMVRTIRESGNALITVINDILDFSKIEAGKMDLENVTMSVVDAVEGVASTLTPNATKKGVRIEVFADPAIPASVHGDPTRLRQILFNLGGNAVKFSEGKDVAIRAGFAGKSDDQRVWLRFSVIDQGIGISKENQAKLFQAFSQAESSTTRRFGGTGLGLAICKRLTEMMGGTLGVDSREGHGSTFWVELPFTPAEAASGSRKDRDLRGLRVLLVGSDGQRGEAIEAYVRHWGGDITRAADAASAAAVLKAPDAPKIDSVMLDLGLDEDRHAAAVPVLRGVAGGKPLILLQDYQHRGARVQEKDIVTVDANPLIRYRIITAVAVAAGRASPEIKNDEDALKFAPVKAQTVDEALAAGQLILLAEDNLTNQDVIKRQLKLLGRACEIANNGVEALAAYKTGRYALLLTDCHMPEMDGYELTGAIRALEQGTALHLPIVAVTANALQGEAERCLAAGMDDYISKPIAMPALVAALKKWMPAAAEVTAVPAAADPAPRAQAIPSANGKDTAHGNGAGVVDDRVIKDMFGDDDATFREILQSFSAPSRDIIDDIMAGQKQRAADAVKDAAHKLKSSARSIGANALADTCATLEAAGKVADWETIDRLAGVAHDQFAAVESYIAALK